MHAETRSDGSSQIVWQMLLHVLLRLPKKSGSMFFNYKNSFSIVMMAVVDADYKFLFVDVGTQGGGVW